MGLWTQERSFYDDWLIGFKHLKAEHLFQILPTTFLFMILSLYTYVKMVPDTFGRKAPAFIISLIIACSIAPVFLVFVAWDVGRILSFSNMNSFLVLITITYIAKGKLVLLNKTEKWLYSISILLLTLFNIFIYYWLPLIFTHENELLKRDFELITFFDFLSKYF